MGISPTKLYSCTAWTYAKHIDLITYMVILCHAYTTHGYTLVEVFRFTSAVLAIYPQILPSRHDSLQKSGTRSIECVILDCAITVLRQKFS